MRALFITLQACSSETTMRALLHRGLTRAGLYPKEKFSCKGFANSCVRNIILKLATSFVSLIQ